MPISIAMAAVLLAQAAPTPPPEEILRNSPHWLRLPTAAEIWSVYPEAARRAAVRGEVVMSCTLDADGWLRACRVTAEQPASQGFGAAALALAPAFRMSPLTPDGQSVAGGGVEVPIRFSGPRGR